MKLIEKIQNKKYSLPLLSLILVGCLGITVLLGGLSAKYAKKTTTTDPAEALNFYFTSDLLSSENTPPKTVLRRGVKTINFDLRNYADELRISEVAISYTVTVERDGITVASERVTFGINASDSVDPVKAVEQLSFDVTEAGTYTVTAEATAPYTATLTGIFVVEDADERLDCEVRDSGAYVTLTVYTEDYEGKIQLVYPSAGLTPDATDPAFDSPSLTANSSHTYRFFKTSNFSAAYNDADVYAKAVSSNG